MISGETAGNGKDYGKARSSTSGMEKQSSTSVMASRVVDGPCDLLAFTLEFDCFTFPAHIPPKSQLGNQGLDIRAVFKINLAGILKAGATEPDWFPGPTAEVNP